MQCEDFRLELCADGVGRYSIMGSWGFGATDQEEGEGEIKRMDYDNLTDYDYDNLTAAADESPSSMSITTNKSANQPIMKQEINVFSS